MDRLRSAFVIYSAFFIQFSGPAFFGYPDFHCGCAIFRRPIHVKRGKLVYPESVRPLSAQAEKEKRLRERLLWKQENLTNPKKKDVSV